jgi:hypothetical protein
MESFEIPGAWVQRGDPLENVVSRAGRVLRAGFLEGSFVALEGRAVLREEGDHGFRGITFGAGEFERLEGF